MGNTESNVTSGVKKQTDTSSILLYKLVNLNGEWNNQTYVADKYVYIYNLFNSQNEKGGLNYRKIIRYNWRKLIQFPDIWESMWMFVCICVRVCVRVRVGVYVYLVLYVLGIYESEKNESAAPPISAFRVVSAYWTALYVSWCLTRLSRFVTTKDITHAGQNRRHINRATSGGANSATCQNVFAVLERPVVKTNGLLRRSFGIIYDK